MNHVSPGLSTGVKAMMRNFSAADNDTVHVPGTAIGHVVAATSYTFMGFLYIIAAHHRYYVCLRTSTKFVSSVDIPFAFLPGRFKKWPILAILKILLGGSYLAMELITATYREPGGNETPYWQHDTQAVAFILSGVVDILSHRNMDSLNSSPNFLLPYGFDYFVMAAAFGIQAELLFSHLHGRSRVDVRVHEFYALLAVACFLAVVAEAKFRYHPMFPVIRGYALMMQGTWIYNLLIILYHPGRERPVLDLRSDSSVSKVSMQFLYHVILNMALVLAVNLTFAYVYTWPENKFTQSLDNDSNELCRSYENIDMELDNEGAVIADNGYDATRCESLVDGDIQSENEFEMMAPAKPKTPSA